MKASNPGYWAASYEPSCIVVGQSIQTSRGWMEVGELCRQWAAGVPVRLMVDGAPADVVLALATSSRARRITLADGRSVELTGSHALPSGQDGYHDGCTVVAARFVAARPPRRPPVLIGSLTIYRHPDGRVAFRNGAAIPTDRGYIIRDGPLLDRDGVCREPEWLDRFRPIAVGDEVDGSIVVRVDDLGVCAAVRIATSEFGWLALRTAAGPVRVGQRWHELPLVYQTPAGLVRTPAAWGSRHATAWLAPDEAIARDGGGAARAAEDARVRRRRRTGARIAAAVERACAKALAAGYDDDAIDVPGVTSPAPRAPVELLQTRDGVRTVAGMLAT